MKPVVSQNPFLSPSGYWINGDKVVFWSEVRKFLRIDAAMPAFWGTMPHPWLISCV